MQKVLHPDPVIFSTEKVRTYTRQRTRPAIGGHTFVFVNQKSRGVNFSRIDNAILWNFTIIILLLVPFLPRTCTHDVHENRNQFK